MKIEMLNEEFVLVGRWHVEDFQGVAANLEEPTELTKEEVYKAREIVARNFDASLGVNWDTIEDAVRQVVSWRD